MSLLTAPIVQESESRESIFPASSNIHFLIECRRCSSHWQHCSYL